MARTLTLNPSSPVASLHVAHHPTPTLPDEPGQVLVKFLVSPINRVDLLVLSGVYPTKPRYTHDSQAIPGFDGCGIVLSSTTPGFQKDDLVIPNEIGLGTWRTHAVFPGTSLIRLPRGTPAVGGALIRSGALVARLLLEEVTALGRGDWIVVSGGLSSVTYFLVQFASRRGINTLLVVRDRDRDAMRAIEERLRRVLTLNEEENENGTIITESELETTAKAAAALPVGPVTMAIDSVFGKVGQGLARVLSPGGKFVLLGMLAGPAASIEVSTKELFYRQISFLPFRSSEILKRIGPARSQALITDIAELFVDGSIKLPNVRLVPWGEEDNDNWEGIQSAVEEAKRKEVGYRKVVWLPNGLLK